MSKAGRRAIAVLVGGALLAGCTSGSTVIDHRSEGTAQFNASILRHAASTDGFHVKIVNAPFPDADREAVARVVTRALKDSHYGVHDVAFRTTEPAPNTNSVVVLFNPVRNVRTEKLCENPDQPTRDAATDGVTVAMALCEPDEPLRWLQASRSGVRGSDEDGFRKLFLDTGRSLFGQTNPGAGNPGGMFM